MTVAAVAAAALVVAGCGGSDNGSSQSASGGSASTPASSGGAYGTSGSSGTSGGGQKVALAADASAIRFDKTALSAKAGKVTIAFDNPSSIPHAIEVEGNGIEQKTGVITNAKASLSLDLKPGTYEFYCPVDGHRQGGMEGTLTVR